MTTRGRCDSVIGSGSDALRKQSKGWQETSSRNLKHWVNGSVAVCTQTCQNITCLRILHLHTYSDNICLHTQPKSNPPFTIYVTKQSVFPSKLNFQTKTWGHDVPVHTDCKLSPDWLARIGSMAKPIRRELTCSRLHSCRRSRHGPRFLLESLLSKEKHFVW